MLELRRLLNMFAKYVPGSATATILCFACRAPHCPQSFLCDAAVLAYGPLAGKYEVMLDNQASVSVFMNPHLLSDIRPSRHPIVISGIGGTLTVTLEGDCPHFGTVYYAQEAPCNVLSFALVSDHHAITLLGCH
jgi:hypothetical protein